MTFQQEGLRPIVLGGASLLPPGGRCLAEFGLDDAQLAVLSDSSRFHRRAWRELCSSEGARAQVSGDARTFAAGYPWLTFQARLVRPILSGIATRLGPPHILP